MPGRYEVLTSETTLQLLSDTATEEVQAFTAQSTQSGAVFTARIPIELYRAREFVSYTDDVLEGRAVFLDLLMEMPEVESANIVQDVNAANQLSDSLIVTVQSSNGRLTMQLPAIPFPTDLAGVQARIETKAAELNQLAGGA